MCDTPKPKGQKAKKGGTRDEKGRFSNRDDFLRYGADRQQAIKNDRAKICSVVFLIEGIEI